MTTLTDDGFWFRTYREHGSSILAFLTSRVGRRDLAEDLLQETFVRVMRHRDRLSESERIRSYLFTTAHHLILDHARRKKPTLFSEMGARDDAPPPEIADADAPSPERAAELERFGDRLEEVLAELPPAHRTAFRAAVLEQRPYREVAEREGWSLEQVKTNVFRGRRAVIARMREALRPERENPS